MSWQRKRLVSFQVTFSSRKSQSQALEKKAATPRKQCKQKMRKVRGTKKAKVGAAGKKVRPNT